MDGLLITSLILIGLGGVGGILLVIAQTQSSARDKEGIITAAANDNLRLNQQLNEAATRSHQLETDLQQRDSENKGQAAEIKSLNLQLLEQSQHFNKFMGASDAFPNVKINAGGSQRGILGFTFTMENQSDYPLYNANINVIDFELLTKNSTLADGRYTMTREDFKKTLIYTEEFAEMTPKESRITSQLFNYPEGLFYIKMSSRGTIYVEKLALTVFQQTVYYGYIIHDLTGKMIKEFFLPTVPPEAKEKLRKKFQQIPELLEINLIN